MHLNRIQQKVVTTRPNNLPTTDFNPSNINRELSTDQTDAARVYDNTNLLITVRFEIIHSMMSIFMRATDVQR